MLQRKLELHHIKKVTYVFYNIKIYKIQQNVIYLIYIATLAIFTDTIHVLTEDFLLRTFLPTTLAIKIKLSVFSFRIWTSIFF